MVTPTITSIKDSKGVEIPPGGITIDTSVTITGTASKGQKVHIRDGADIKDDTVAHPTTGIWSSRISELSLGSHTFTSKGLYGSEPVSDLWEINVAESAIVEDFEDYSTSKQLLFNGTIIDLKHFKITARILNGTADFDIIHPVDLSDHIKGGALEQHVAHSTSRSRTLIIDFKRACSKIEFWYAAHYSDRYGSIRIFYAEKNESKPLTSTKTEKKFEFSAIGIYRIELKQMSLLDSFKLSY